MYNIYMLTHAHTHTHDVHTHTHTRTNIPRPPTPSTHIHTNTHTYSYTSAHIRTHTHTHAHTTSYRVATISRLLKIIGLFCKEPHKRDYILQKRRTIFRKLLIVATP